MVTAEQGRDLQTAAGQPDKSAQYRADLDGLRGLAIALVVAFHIWFGRVSGGVDVFLVLSGFFFTGLLLRRAEREGSVGVGFTFRRTARRLLPALFLVLAAVVVACIAVRPYTQWSDLASQVLASAFYYQNWHLALTWSDYLAADPSVSPLQHLWSMSVQGQYYVGALVVVAGIAWLVGRRRPRLLRPAVAIVVVAGMVASFVYATLGMAQQGWNYYDTGARAWEMLAGAALALAAPYFTPPRWLRTILAAAGVAAVVACGWLITDGSAEFPGPLALLPVGAAVVLIISANNVPETERSWVNRLLSTPVMRRLGDISYSLYLWHWPFLIFYLVERGRTKVGLLGGVAIIAVSLVLAWLTNRYVEEPLRLRSTPRRGSASYRRFAGVAVAVVSIAVVGVTGAWQIAVVRVNPPQAVGELDPEEYPGAEALVSGTPAPQARMRPTVFEAPAELPPPTVDGCIADWNTREVRTCTYGDPNATRTLAVVGNSHAEHWIPALQVLAAKHSFRIQVYLKMGCALTLSDNVSYKGETNPDCRDWSHDVIDRLGQDRPDWIFTTGTKPRDFVGDETPQDYVDVWSALSDRGLNVVAIRDTPWLRHNGIRYKAADCLAKGGNRLSCGIRRDEALDPVNPELEPASHFANVHPIDLTDAVCEPDVCPVVEGNILIYHDEHHFTATYSRSLAGSLERQLQPVLEWW